MIRRKILSIALLSFTALLFSGASIHAQGRIGTIQGTVKDPNGAVVPNAKVTLKQSVTGYTQSAQSDADGTFKLVNVPFNTYTIRAEAAGFQASDQPVEIEAGRSFGQKGGLAAVQH